VDTQNRATITSDHQGSGTRQTKQRARNAEQCHSKRQFAATGVTLTSRTQLADCRFISIPDSDLDSVTGGDGIGRTIGKYVGAGLAGGATAAASSALIPFTGGFGLFVDGALTTAAGAAGYDIGGNIGDTVENAVNDAGRYAKNLRPTNPSLPVPSLFDQ
jgi:hypothetical protein